MGSILAALFDPAAQECDLFRSQRLSRVGWRHARVWVVGFDAEDELAVFGIAWDDGRSGFARGMRVLRAVEPELGFARGGVWSVASEALVGEDRADVAREVDGRIFDPRLPSFPGLIRHLASGDFAAPSNQTDSNRFPSAQCILDGCRLRWRVACQ